MCDRESSTRRTRSSAATGKSPTRKGNLHPMITPYETYKTKDSYVIIAVGNDAMWRRFCPLVGRETFLAGTEPPPCQEHGGVGSQIYDWWRRLRDWWQR